MTVFVVLLLHAVLFGLPALAFRPHPNGATVGSATYTEWGEPQEHPEYA